MEPEAPPEIRPQPAEKVKRATVVAWAIIIGVFLLTICAWGTRMLLRLTATSQAPSEELPAVNVNPPAVNLPTLAPSVIIPTSAPTSVRLPVIQSTSAPVWKVKKIKSLGYQLGNSRRELAIFIRSSDQVTVQGYCLNPGWDVPEIGAEYSLNDNDIFVPLHEAKPNTVQRFQRIK